MKFSWLRAKSRDTSWERFGVADPYWAVLTVPQFRRGAMTSAARAEFFASGDWWMDSVLEDAHRFFGPLPKAVRALDFGCGVGRLVFPLAKRFDEVTGVDVAESMLEEARKNARALGVDNTTFVASDDALTKLDGVFDFIHSYIVFQHIPVASGLALYAGLLDRLAPGGIAALHFVTRERGSRLRNAIDRIRLTRTPFRQLSNVFGGRSPFAPVMQMNEYDLGELVAIAAERGLGEVHIRHVAHGNYLGVMMYLRKP